MTDARNGQGPKWMYKKGYSMIMVTVEVADLSHENFNSSCHEVVT